MGWLSAFAGELGLRLYRVKVSNQPTPVVQWLSALQREQSTPIKKFKSRDGKALVDGYLVDQMTKAHPWARKVYDFTSGYVHFSERQFFDSIHSVRQRSRAHHTVTGQSHRQQVSRVQLEGNCCLLQ